MALTLLFLLLAAQQPEPPRTVNDQILGKAEDFQTIGPARVCIGATSVDIETGETAYLDYLGIHWGGIRVSGPNGTFLVMDGEMFVTPRKARLVKDSNGRQIARTRVDGKLKYLIYGPNAHSARDRPRTSVQGDALGKGRDEAILSRITIGHSEPSGCRRHFEYGWDYILGESE